ncbi:phosphoenolpyruvate carboxykinase (ATP) [Lentzea tibetensis]|uniref:hypothetical protein n=1 Tax=Lentzea tibetensis TaxID=2591470 RepID=UPI001646F2B0|nr:hypothetical protein [Lentzea tibetensis]
MPEHPNGLHRYRFACGRSEVDVRTDVRTAAELDGLSRPFFQRKPVSSDSAPAPLVWATTAPPAGEDWERLTFSSETEPDRVLWVNHARREIAFVAPPSAWRTQQLLRSVRNLIRWQAYERGELFVHGGMVAVGDVGIAFLGRKRAGKTSNILSALINAAADFVSNDDLVLAPGPDGVVGQGYPRAITIRLDSLMAVTKEDQRLRKLVHDVKHPINHHRVQESLFVRCAELVVAAGTELRPRHPLQVVAFPQFVDAGERTGVEKLDRAEAAELLAEHTESEATDHDPFLASWFPSYDAAARTAVTDQLLDSATFLRLRQDFDDMGSATSALLEAAGLAAPVPAGTRR